MRPTVRRTSKESKKHIQKNDHFTIRIPRLSFKNTSLNTYLVFALVVFAFILGMLTNKVLYLENQLKSGTQAVNQPSQAAIPTQVELPQYVKVDSGHLAQLGNANAKITIVEFSDFQCPFCKAYFEDTHAQLKAKYVDTGKAKFVYRHFPLTSIHPNAYKAALSSECANDQNKFWEYHDLLFKNQEIWSPQTSADASTSFISYALQLGLDTEAFQSCLDTEKFKKNVDDDMNAGNQAQVDGTPAFFINGYRLVGAQPFSSFEKVIEDELKK